MRRMRLFKYLARISCAVLQSVSDFCLRIIYNILLYLPKATRPYYNNYFYSKGSIFMMCIRSDCRNY